MLILSATGHRPDKLGGYGQAVLNRLTALAKAALQKYIPDKVISGMALGWDTAVALASIDLQIPFIAAIPCEGQDALWPDEAKARYHAILQRAERVVMTGPGGSYAPFKMNIRNEWMVDNCDMVLALFNGSAGGTANCLAYAKSKQVNVVNLWKSWVKYGNIRKNS